MAHTTLTRNLDRLLQPELSTLANLLYFLLLLLALFLPFEMTRYRLSFPWFEWTNVELLFVILLPGAALLAFRQVRRIHSKALLAEHQSALLWLIPLALLWLLLALLSALLAPDNRYEALKFVTRFANGLILFFLTIRLVHNARQLRGVLGALMVGTLLSALMGIGEAAEWSTITPLLLLFKSDSSRVGGELRVSASFQFATEAAIYFEMMVPLALGMVATARRRATRCLALLLALLFALTVILTLTRAAMGALLVVLVALLVVGWWRYRATELVRYTAVVLGSLLLFAMILAIRSDTFRARLTTENDLSWYNASYQVPAIIEIQSEQGAAVTVEARNEGAAPWRTSGDHAYALGYRWLNEDGSAALQLPAVDVPLPHDVPPGESVQLHVMLSPAAPPGRYRIAWGMLQQEVLWFRHRGVPEAESVVEITPGVAATRSVPNMQPRDDLPSLPPTVSRRDLWRVAFQMWQERPLVGIGPDNFRHLYGQYLGLPQWDERISANNLYLELLATLGLPALLAFLALVASVLWQLVHYLHHTANAQLAALGLALGAATGTFLLHGLFDYFLGSVSIYLLFWLTLGLTTALTVNLAASEPAERKAQATPHRNE